MKNLLLLVFAFCYVAVLAQDEGTIVKRERIQRDKNIFVGGGISILGGSNSGDYSSGLNIEAGYGKRLNRVFSIGGSFSFLRFKYDASVLNNKPTGTTLSGFPSNFYYDGRSTLIDEGFLVALTGGDVSVMSLALNLKFNFVPVKDNSVISVYGFAKPFIANAATSEIKGFGEYVFYDNNQSNWFYNTANDGQVSYAAKSNITGGIFVGPGVEFFPAKAVSFFAQASFGYTFPFNVISTKSFGNDVSKLPDDFPLKSIGFTSINFAAGISFNLD